MVTRFILKKVRHACEEGFLNSLNWPNSAHFDKYNTEMVPNFFHNPKCYVVNLRCTAILTFPTQNYLPLFLFPLSLPLGDRLWVLFACLLLFSILKDVLVLRVYDFKHQRYCLSSDVVAVSSALDSCFSQMSYTDGILFQYPRVTASPLHSLVFSVFSEYLNCLMESLNLCLANQKLF